MLNVGVCDRLDVHIVSDNYVDCITNSSDDVTRHGIIYHFTAGNEPVLADPGFCAVVDAYIGQECKRILIDGGWCSDVALHNMKIMGIDPATIQTVILSHGHPDHFTGLPGVLKAIGHSVPLYTHPDAFFPRVIVREGSFTSDVFNRDLTVANLEAAGGRVALVRSPVMMASGFMYSGQIERTVDFEEEVPKGRYSIRDGELKDDFVLDDSAIICNVKGKGLVVIMVCGHAGAVNTSKHAQKITGEQNIYAVLGGFHMGHFGLNANKANKTIEALKEMGVKKVAPIHCSGMVTKFATAKFMPDEYVDIGAACTLHF